MCNKSTLNEITNKVVKAAKESLGEKLDKVILYGSYARGDYTDESDIDIMVLADISKDEVRNIEKELWNTGWELGFEYDILVCVYVTDCFTFNKFINDLPYYSNINKEGILLSA